MKIVHRFVTVYDETVTVWMGSTRPGHAPHVEIRATVEVVHCKARGETIVVRSAGRSDDVEAEWLPANEREVVACNWNQAVLRTRGWVAAWRAQVLAAVNGRPKDDLVEVPPNGVVAVPAANGGAAG